uniref:Uncharacterized protein n=1 Tax=Oryza sativa subsp. japonica TaxID=39947 RepID=Q8S6I2_ORYSJ|nr:Hypothetical protein [Oryza sativa Japonica Group]
MGVRRHKQRESEAAVTLSVREVEAAEAASLRQEPSRSGGGEGAQAPPSPCEAGAAFAALPSAGSVGGRAPPGSRRSSRRAPLTPSMPPHAAPLVAASDEREERVLKREGKERRENERDREETREFERASGRCGPYLLDALWWGLSAHRRFLILKSQVSILGPVGYGPTTLPLRHSDIVVQS